MSSSSASSKPIEPADGRPLLNAVSGNAVARHNQSARFAATLTREVRNPLTTINLSVEMLYSAITDPELRSYLDLIMRSSVRIDKSLNELLSHQHAEEIPMGYYSFHQLLDEALTMTTDRMLLKSIKLNKDYATEDDRVFVDKEKVRFALVNILLSAISAMPQRKGELTVITRSLGRKYAVEIADNGTAMRPGLSSTLEILQYNHIGVDVSSKEGQGTSFMLFVDIAA